MEKLNINVGQISHGTPTIQRLIEESRGISREAGKEKAIRRGPVYLEDVLNWIKKQGYDNFTETSLIKVASSYPNGALRRFYTNFNNHLASIQKLKREDTSEGKIVRKKELDIETLSEEKRQSALRQKMLARIRFEEEEKERQESQLEQLKNQEKNERVREMFAPPPNVFAAQLPAQTRQPQQSPPQYQQPQQPQQTQQTQQPQGPNPQEVAKALEMRRRFAKRLEEIGQEDELTDKEWLGG